MIKWILYILVNFPPLDFRLSKAKIPQKLLRIVRAIKTLIMAIFALECSSLMVTENALKTRSKFFENEQILSEDVYPIKCNK